MVDSSNAAVPGARVTLRNVSTGAVSISQTNSAGQYLFNYILPGNYTATVEQAGFREFVQENVTVLAAGDVTVNAHLEVGAVSQTVTVTAAPPGVQFNTTNMSLSVQPQLVRSLPIQQDNPYSLALLDSAVVNEYWDPAHRLPFYMWAAGGTNISGPTSGMNDVELDGMSTLAGGESAYTRRHIGPFDTLKSRLLDLKKVNQPQGATDNIQSIWKVSCHLSSHGEYVGLRSQPYKAHCKISRANSSARRIGDAIGRRG